MRLRRSQWSTWIVNATAYQDRASRHRSPSGTTRLVGVVTTLGFVIAFAILTLE